MKYLSKQTTNYSVLYQREIITSMCGCCHSLNKIQCLAWRKSQKHINIMKTRLVDRTDNWKDHNGSMYINIE